MKKIILLSSFLCFSAYLFAQDVIVTIENDSIEAKIIMTYDAVVKYELFGEQGGQTYLIPKANISTIIYENGVVETYASTQVNSAHSNTAVQNITNSPEKIFKNAIKIKPFATILGAIAGYFEIDLLYTRYLTPKFGIPVEVDLAFISELGFGFGLMTGIEAVPFTHRQKSGFFINALAGVLVYDDASFMANINVGYQLITKTGFVFNALIGPMYYGATNQFRARFSLDFGFAF